MSEHTREDVVQIVNDTTREPAQELEPSVAALRRILRGRIEEEDESDVVSAGVTQRSHLDEESCAVLPRLFETAPPAPLRASERGIRIRGRERREEIFRSPRKMLGKKSERLRGSKDDLAVRCADGVHRRYVLQCGKEQVFDGRFHLKYPGNPSKEVGEREEVSTVFTDYIKATRAERTSLRQADRDFHTSNDRETAFGSGDPCGDSQSDKDGGNAPQAREMLTKFRAG